MVSTLSLLEKLIRINSINPFSVIKSGGGGGAWELAGNETEIKDFLKNVLMQQKFKVREQYVHSCHDENGREEKFYNLLAEKGKGPGSILFYGHMDTAGSLPWPGLNEALTPRKQTGVFSGKHRNVISGLGASDMKAGIAVMLTAFENIEPENYRIKLAFGVDEEFYSLGANVLAPSSFLDDVKAIIVSEAGAGPAIGLGRMGRCEYVIDVPGTGGHGASANNPSFINAAEESSKIVRSIERGGKEYRNVFKLNKKFEADKIEGGFFVSKIDAGEGSLAVPARGKIIVDWTFAPGFTIENGLEYLRGLIDSLYKEEVLKKTCISGKFCPVKVSVRKRPTPHNDAYLVPEGHPFVKFVAGFTERKYSFCRSVADENVFSRIRPDIPILILGPSGGGAHKAGEWVDLDSVRELKNLYKNMAVKFESYPFASRPPGLGMGISRS